jgi:hypothetical protein
MKDTTMKIPHKNIAHIFLFMGALGLFADKFIPHTHHHLGSSAIIDFDSEASQSDSKENDEAGEKIHSEFFNISESAHSLQLTSPVILNDILFALNTNIPIPDIPIFTIEKYFLLPKIINLTHLIIKYFTYKAPPIFDVHNSQFTTKNIYRSNQNERIKKSELAMV